MHHWELSSKAFSQAVEDGADSIKWTSVKEVLEDSTTVKVFCDPRSDSDALYHHYGILLQNVFCAQLAEVALRRLANHKVRYVKSRKQITQKYGQFSEEELWDALASANGKNQGGPHVNLKKRPLGILALKYSARGVSYLLRIYERMEENLSTKKDQCHWVKEESKVRVEECLLPSYGDGTGAVAPEYWVVITHFYPEQGGGRVKSFRTYPHRHGFDE